MNKDQKEILDKLSSYREDIEYNLQQIEILLQTYFEEEFPVAYQHWIPQIKTALRDDTKWLPRGRYSMQYTLNRLIDKIINDLDKGVSKYI